MSRKYYLLRVKGTNLILGDAYADWFKFFREDDLEEFFSKWENLDELQKYIKKLKKRGVKASWEVIKVTKFVDTKEIIDLEGV